MALVGDRPMSFDAMGMQTNPGDLKSLEELAHLAAKSSESQEAVEVGSWAGRTALKLLSAFDILHCIDTWEGTSSDWNGEIAKLYGPMRAFQTFCKNMGPKLLYRRVWPHVGTSLFYASVWPRRVGLVFIDADHDYEMVYADIKAWLPLVEPGGLLICHDYGLFHGVTRAVDELLPRKRRAGDTLAWIQKE